MPPDRSRLARIVDTAAILFALGLPTVAAWFYFGFDGDASGLRKAAYAIGKATQFGFPAIWWLTVRRRWPALRLKPGKDLAGVFQGLAFGGAAFLATLVVYHGWLEPAGYFATSGRVIQGRLIGFGIDSLAAYLAVAVFYSLIHSFLEEYYWRWFVFGGLRTLMGPWPAILVSSIGFMAHHVIVLSVYFGWLSPATLFFSLAVAVGGGVWAWIYHRSGSLAGPWASHLLADAAIFAVGFELIRPLLGL